MELVITGQKARSGRLDIPVVIYGFQYEDEEELDDHATVSLDYLNPVRCNINATLARGSFYSIYTQMFYKSRLLDLTSCTHCSPLHKTRPL